MKIEMIDISKKKIPIVFSSSYDYIAYVRQQCPNPWTRVYLKTESKFIENNTLKSANIFCYTTKEELNELRQNESEIVLGIDLAFLVVTKDLLDKNKKDDDDIGATLTSIIDSFVENVNVKIFDILLYFDNMSEENIILLNQIHDFAISDSSFENIHFIYPKEFVKYLRIDSKNIDIISHIDKIRNARRIGKFKMQMLIDLENFVQTEQSNGKTKIAYSGLENFADLRYIVPYLYFKYNLEFVYSNSLITWITDSNFIYLYNRHSLFERLKFIRNLPAAFCLNIKKSYKRADCRLQSYTTPDVVAVYNFETCEEADLTVDWVNDIFVDFRDFFIDKEPIIKDTTINVNHETFKDYETDKMLVDKFINMDINKYITIKNSILLKRDNILYLVHTKGDFSLDVIIQIQTVLPNLEYTIKESEFHCIYSHPILKKIVGEVQPAYSIDARLLSVLFNENPSTLSYYERALRWCKILEDEDFNIFQEISLKSIRKEPTSKYFISCFGNPLNFSKHLKTNVAMRVTNKIMEGKRLP